MAAAGRDPQPWAVMHGYRFRAAYGAIAARVEACLPAGPRAGRLAAPDRRVTVPAARSWAPGGTGEAAWESLSERESVFRAYFPRVIAFECTHITRVQFNSGQVELFTCYCNCIIARIGPSA